jgi:hypothetical protein
MHIENLKSYSVQMNKHGAFDTIAAIAKHLSGCSPQIRSQWGSTWDRPSHFFLKVKPFHAPDLL